MKIEMAAPAYYISRMYKERGTVEAMWNALQSHLSDIEDSHIPTTIT